MKWLIKYTFYSLPFLPSFFPFLSFFPTFFLSLSLLPSLQDLFLDMSKHIRGLWVPSSGMWVLRALITQCHLPQKQWTCCERKNVFFTIQDNVIFMFWGLLWYLSHGKCSLNISQNNRQQASQWVCGTLNKSYVYFLYHNQCCQISSTGSNCRKFNIKDAWDYFCLH